MTDPLPANSRPLSGLRVIDVSTVLAGPFCGQMMADLGADVIKIERPGGDENRQWPPVSEAGNSCNFMSVNRGKRSIVLNLKQEDDLVTFRELLGTADVLIHNYLPTVAARLGLDFETLHKAYPDLIACSISGYGANGPLRHEPGYDATVACFAGVTSLTGEPDRLPVRSGISAIDMATGVYAYGGLMTALLARPQQGGQLVRVSLLETAVSFLGYLGVGWLEAGVLPQRAGSGSEAYVPYQIFRCSDGEIFVGALANSHFEGLCDTIGHPELKAVPGFDTMNGRNTRRAELIDIIQAALLTQPRDYWTERLRACGVPVAPINTIAQALSHEQVLANDMVVNVPQDDGSVARLIGMPFKLSSVGSPDFRPVPRVGQHGDEIRKELVGRSSRADASA